jgi:hypothetical protein
MQRKPPMPRILIYGEYASLVAARAMLLRNVTGTVTASLDLNESVRSASAFDAVVVCTSASPEAVKQLRERQATLPQTFFLFLGKADFGQAKPWLSRVVEWKTLHFSRAGRSVAGC